MRQRLRLLVPVLVAAFILVSVSCPQAAQAQTTLSVSGRQLLVNGQPFTVRGVNYKPTPYTGTYNWGDDWTLNTSVTAADLAKMQEMGANTIRVYVTYERLFNNWDSHDPNGDSIVAAELSRYQTALSQAQSRGIYVIMNYWVPYGLDYTQATTRSWHKIRFRKIINTFKSLSSYPNVLMWAFGNENNLNRGSLTQAQLFAYYGEAVSEAKSQADATHPYTVVLGDDLSINNASLTGSAPSVDIWSLNVYQTAQGYTNLINAYTLAKPLLLSEFGADAFNNAAGSEDQASQANFYTDRWNNYIKPNLSAANGGNKLLGAAVFEWNDEWWKAGSNATHDAGGWSGNVPPDNFLNEEWFGLSTALPDGSSGPRAYRQAYNALKTMWATQVTPTPSPTATRTPAAATPTPVKTSTTPAATSTPTWTSTPLTATATPTNTATPLSATATPTAANLALNRTATGSAPCNSTTETAPKAVDGSTGTKWCSGASSKWLQVDLGSSRTVARFVVRHAGAGGENAGWNTNAFTIQTSPDGVAWSTAVSVTGNTANTTTHTVTVRSARYVKLNIITATSTGDAAARIYELEVYAF
jgi:hypothetical protein